jgi:streptogramin lyase
MGEVEVIGDKVGGIAVHVGARVMSKAGAHEVLISSTVRDLLTGADLRFDDRGFQELKGVEASMHLYAVRPAEDLDEDATPAALHAPEPTAGRRIPLIALAGGGMVVLLTIAVVVLTRGGTDAFPRGPDTVARVDPSSGALVGGVAVGTSPGSIVAEAGTVWVANFDDQTIQAIDEDTGEAGPAQGVGNPTGLAVGADRVWVANGYADSIVAVDPTVSNAKETISLPEITGIDDAHPTDVAFGEGSLWVTDDGNAMVYRIDPSTMEVVPISLDPGSDPSAIAVGDGAVWVAMPAARAVVEIDPATDAARDPIPLTEEPRAIAIGEGAVWVTLPQADGVLRMDPGSDARETIGDVGGSPQGVSTAAGRVWVANAAGSLTWLDATTGEVLGHAALAGTPWDVAATERGVWVTIRD